MGMAKVPGEQVAEISFPSLSVWRAFFEKANKNDESYLFSKKALNAGRSEALAL